MNRSLASGNRRCAPTGGENQSAGEAGSGREPASSSPNSSDNPFLSIPSGSASTATPARAIERAMYSAMLPYPSHTMKCEQSVSRGDAARAGGLRLPPLRSAA